MSSLLQALFGTNTALTDSLTHAVMPPLADAYTHVLISKVLIRGFFPTSSLES